MSTASLLIEMNSHISIYSTIYYVQVSNMEKLSLIVILLLGYLPSGFSIPCTSSPYQKNFQWCGVPAACNSGVCTRAET